MKKSTIISIIFCLIVFLTNLNAQQWHFSGLEGREVYKITVDPVDNNVLYVGCVWSSSGLFRSKDAGV